MKKIILKAIVLLSLMFIGLNFTEAASYTISVSSKNISKGNKVKLTIKGSDVTGRFNIKTSNSSVVSISEDRVWIENNSYSITLNALKVGTSTITVTPSGVSDGNGNAASLSSKSITITVSLPREKSTDNTLKSLSVEGFEISPTFDKDTIDYSVSVPEGTKSINVSASANSKYATVKGTGKIDVSEGANNLSIVVKAESGAEKIYNLVVNVIDQNPINVTVDGENYTVIKLRDNYKCPDLYEDSEIIIDNVSVPSCTNNKINYILVGLKKDNGEVISYRYNDGKYEKYNELVGTSIKLINEKYKGNVENLKETTITIDEEKYQAFKFSDTSKYYVVYGVNIETGEKGLYVYDSVNKTFSGYDTELIDYLQEQNKIYLYVIIAFGVSLFLSLICMISLSKKKKKLKKKLLDAKEEKNDTKENKKKSKKEEIEESKELEQPIEEEKSEDKNTIQEINNNDEEETQTYYLFESDKKKKRRK